MILITQTTDLVEVKQPQRNFPYLIIVLILLILLGGYKVFDKWKPHPDNPLLELNDETGDIRFNPSIIAKDQEKIKKQHDGIDNHVQYKLVAVNSGWYPCFNCYEDGRQSIFLTSGEVWKYGTTKERIGAARYSKLEYALWGVNFVVQMRGTLNECKKQESTLIGTYKESLENRFRLPKNRINYPPGNTRID